jgi:hypothetical protein
MPSIELGFDASQQSAQSSAQPPASVPVFCGVETSSSADQLAAGQSHSPAPKGVWQASVWVCADAGAVTTRRAEI